nr:hypothetical protein [uncultured Desulfobulbus sp.]
MTTQSLSISYSGPDAASAKDLLQLEQSPWGAYTSRVTRAEMVRYLSALLYGTEYSSHIDCGLVNGAVVCVVAAYPRVPDLVYRLHTSHGALSSPAREMPLLTEALSFRLTTELSPAHPVRKIKSVEWLSECYNAEGAVVDPPPLSTDGETITIPTAVYGSVSVTYRTERHSYVLTSPRREDAIDNYYSAAVYALYDGGISWLVIEMPPGIETFEINEDAECGWGSTASITDDDQDYPVTDGKHTRTTDVDYCSQEIISEEIL